MIIVDKLSEKILQTILRSMFPQVTSIEKQTFRSSNGKRMIVDYYIEIDEFKLAFEFDGPTHYTRSATQHRDVILAEYCKDNNITLIRIPYFVQLTNDSVQFLFGKDLYNRYNLADVVQSTYEHGFIDASCVLPGDFNSHGQEMFCDFIKSTISSGHASIAKEIQTNAHKKNRIEFIGLLPVQSLEDFWTIVL